MEINFKFEIGQEVKAKHVTHSLHIVVREYAETEYQQVIAYYARRSDGVDLRFLEQDLTPSEA